MEKQLNCALRKAVSFLENAGYGYAIIGGIALASGTLPVTLAMLI